MERKAIVTMPPYATFIDEVLGRDIVLGIRLNVVMPLKETETKEEVLKRLYEKVKEKEKDLWIDLKAMQLRVKGYATPPFTEINLSHEIEVFTPCRAYFHERWEGATILEVDGNRLIMEAGPKRTLGPGESVTIPHSTLKIKGYFTEEDLRYIEAAKKVGIHNYMLSFVESEEDVKSLLALDSEASVVSKIESPKGLNYVRKGSLNSRLMAARGDLYMELKYPHQVAEGVELILSRDKNAIVASRLLDSLENYSEPSCSDIGDLDNLLRMGYGTFMFGDEVCQEREKIIAALNVFELMAERNYDPKLIKPIKCGDKK